MLKILMWTVISLVVLLGLTFGFLQTGPGKAIVRDIVVDVLNGAIKGRIEVDRIDGFLPFDALIEGVRIYDPEGQLVLSVASVTADFHPLDLLERQIRLSNVLVSEPEVTIFDADGRIALLRAFAPREASPDIDSVPWLIAFEGVRLDEGTIERILPGPEDLSLGNLSLDLVLRLGPDGLEWPRLVLEGTPIGRDGLAELIGGNLVIATSGGLSGNGVNVDSLEIDAGGHRLHAHGRIGFGGEVAEGAAPIEVALELTTIRVELSRLPAEIRDLIATETSGTQSALDNVLTGSGTIGLARDGAARLEVGFDLPLGLIAIVAAGDIDFEAASGDAMLLDWFASFRLTDVAIPLRIAAQLPSSARARRIDVLVAADGRGLPPGRVGDGRRLHLEVDVFEHGGPVDGHVYATVDREVGDAVAIAPVYRAQVQVGRISLQPWLELVGEPALTGDVTALYTEARIVVPEAGTPSISGLASFDLSADGFLRAVEPTVAVRAANLTGHASVDWDGVALPTGRLDLTGVDLGFDVGRVGALELGFDLVEQRGEFSVVGSLMAERVVWADASIGRIEVPLSLALGETLASGAIPAGTIRWQASDIRQGERHIASTHGNLFVAPERRGLRVRGTVASGAARLDRQTSLGSADLNLDLWLAPSGTAPVGGPISGRVDGTVTRLRQGANRVDLLELVDLRVDVPLTAEGLAGTIAAVGTVRASGVSAPGATVGRVTAELDGRLHTRTMEATGRASIRAREVVVETGAAQLGEGGAAVIGKVQRLDVVEIDAEARPGGVIALKGVATQPKTKSDTPALEARFTGEVVLPARGRAFEANLAKLELFRQGDLEPTLTLGRTSFRDGGWIELEDLVIRSSRRAGVITASGRFRPSDGAIELSLDANDLTIARWVSLVRDVFHWLDVDAEPLRDFSEDFEGRLAMNLDASGTLAAPRLKGRLRVGGLRYKTHRDGHLDFFFETTATRIISDLSVRWHSQSALGIHADLPAQLSLAPLALGWDSDEPIELEVKIDEPDLDRTRAIAQTLLPDFDPPDVAGSLDFMLRVWGTPNDPRLNTALLMDELDLSPTWRDGKLTMEGSAREDASGFRVELVDARDRTQVRLDIQLPFAIPRAFRERDPFGWMRGRLDTHPFLVEVKVPIFSVHETPLASLLPPDFNDLAAEVDMRLGGTFVDPVVRGFAALKSPDALPISLGFRLDVDTEPTGLVHSRIAVTRPGGDALLEGSLRLPQLSTILRTPHLAGEVAKDPQLTFELFSSEIRSTDFWELKEGLGDLFAQLFPDGWLMLNARAVGGPKGLVAGLYLRVRTTPPMGYIAPALDDPTAARRNAADDVRLAITVAEKTSMSLVMTQDTRQLTPALGVHVVLDVSGDSWVSGSFGKLDAIPIEVGRIQAGDFRLEGFAGVFKSILGNSGGALGGHIIVSGTLGAPRFEGGLTAQFAPFIIAPMGLEHDTATVLINFENGTDWKLVLTELYSEELTARVTANRCGVVPRVLGKKDYTKMPYLTVALEGSIPRLVTREMRLGGCIGMKDYPLLRTKSMEGRIDGVLQLSGTAARPALSGELTVVGAILAPELASKSVRPIGAPLGVTIVRGDPVPPAFRPVKNPFQTGVALDINVILPKNAVRVEPSLIQPYGEVRALLYPHGELRVRTIAGELSLVGIIDVPRETVFLYGKTFNVDPDSRLVFTGDMATDPQLFFTARHNIAHVDLSSIGLQTIKDSEVVVRVTGSPTAPRLEFSSNPVMDETNVLSVIALGVPAGGGEALGDAVQSQLLTAVMGMATLQFARDFQQRLALDVLRIEARSSDPTDTRLTLGKRLSSDLYLNYYLNLAAREGEDQQSGSLEWRFTRYLSLLARGGDAGDVGLEFNLRFQDSPPPARSSPRRRERADSRPRQEPESIRGEQK